SGSPNRAQETTRFEMAHRQAGGAAAESLWQFPVASHLSHGEPVDLVKAWDKQRNGRAAEQLMRQLVLAVRMWRPDLSVTDNDDPKSTCFAADALVAEAVREAFVRAADPKQFPEQLTSLGLEPWRASKLYSCCENHAPGGVVLDLTAPSASLQASPRDFAT